jgi:STE24 endopeptidase
LEQFLQVVAVVAHELGHWKLGHTICLMVSQSLIMLAQFMLFAVFQGSSNLLRSFGFETEKPVIISLMLFLMVIQPVDKIIGWLFNLLSRRCAL